VAATQPPNRASRSARVRQNSGAGPDPISRSDRGRKMREHRSERQFAAWFLIVFVVTLMYVLARSPLNQLLVHH
jgi:type VI protein secretion system component VasF